MWLFVSCKYNIVNDSFLKATLSIFAEIQSRIALEQKPASRHLETLGFRICDFAVRCSLCSFGVSSYIGRYGSFYLLYTLITQRLRGKQRQYLGQAVYISQPNQSWHWSIFVWIRAERIEFLQNVTKRMPDIMSAGERRDLSGWSPAREAYCPQHSCFSSVRNRRTLRQCLTTRYRVAWSLRVKRARFSHVIRRYVTRVAKAELQLLINRYDFLYSKFGWGSRLIVDQF